VTSLTPRRPRLAIAGGGLAALTATLATTGVLRGVDQSAVDRAMPWLRVHPHPFVTIGSLTLPSLDGPAADIALDLWTYPAAVLPSLVLVLLGASRLTRRDAIAWCALWCAGNAIELAGKLTLHEPALYHHGLHVAWFDTSLPSGHTIRAFVVAGALASASRLARVAFVWAATVPIALVVMGAHTPTDVIAGIFVAAALAGWAPNVRAA
jgi:membrane-associated phospholipid phosphatase